jgi:hypothetical protein
VGSLGLLKRFRQEGDTARWLATGYRKSSVHPPQIRQSSGRHALAPSRRRAKGVGRLTDIVLKEPRLGQRAPNLDLLIAMQAGLTQRSHEKGGGFHAGSTFQRPRRLTVKIGRRHGAQYSRYTGGGGYLLSVLGFGFLVLGFGFRFSVLSRFLVLRFGLGSSSWSTNS